MKTVYKMCYTCLVWHFLEELMKEFVVNRPVVCCGEGHDILVSNVVESRDCVQSAAVVLVTQKCNSFRLRLLCQFLEQQ